MDKKHFSDGEIISVAWDRLKRHFLVLFGSAILVVALLGIPQLIATIIQNNILTIIVFLYYFFGAIYFTIGFYRMVIAAADDKDPEFALLFSGHDVFFPFLGVTILYGLIVMGGMLLFVVPGVIWMLKYLFAPWLVIDQKMSPMDALNKSAEMTDGLKWDLLAFYFLVSTIAMLGAIALYVGMIITVPLSLMALAVLYRHLGPAHPAKK